MQPGFRPIISTSLLLLAICAQSAENPQPLPCEGRQAGLGIGEITCPVAPAAGLQRLRIIATFAGVHDDSQATLSARLNDAAIRCGEGSRLQLRGEDSGDTLVCNFELDAQATASLLQLRLTWHHAEPAGLTVTKE